MDRIQRQRSRYRLPELRHTFKLQKGIYPLQQRYSFIEVFTVQDFHLPIAITENNATLAKRLPAKESAQKTGEYCWSLVSCL